MPALNDPGIVLPAGNSLLLSRIEGSTRPGRGQPRLELFRKSLSVTARTAACSTEVFSENLDEGGRRLGSSAYPNCRPATSVIVRSRAMARPARLLEEVEGKIFVTGAGMPS